jgi:hypothetical protein
MFYFYDTKTKFQVFLKRPDMEQDLVDAFQKEYNGIEEDFRVDHDVKAELHLRVEELRDKLWEVSDRRRDEAEAERISIIEDRWIEDQSFILSNIIVTMAQAESDRFFNTRQFIIDYYKDCNGVTVTENNKPLVKLAYSSLNGQPPIEIANALIAASEAASVHRKESQQQATKTVEVASIKVKEGKEKKKERKEEKGAKSDSKTPAAAPAAIAFQPEMAVFDPESTNFSDITSTVEYLYSVLVSPEYSLKEVAPVESVKDKKGVVEQKGKFFITQTIEEQDKIPTDAIKYIEMEETMLRQRVERLRQKATEIYKDLRNRAHEVYTGLDEWIGFRYKSEIDAARDLTVLIREAIEAEQRLPNQILLEGDKLYLDFGTLVLQPDPEPRPESPIEKTSGEYFSIAQLTNLAKELGQLAPLGTISTKQMLEYFSRAGIFAVANDSLPESYIFAEPGQIQQLISSMDPMDTGFLNWRCYWMNLARILPVPTESLLSMKKAFQAYGGSPMSLDSFNQIGLWFERGQIMPGHFDRPKKLKESIYGRIYIYSYT